MQDILTVLVCPCKMKAIQIRPFIFFLDGQGTLTAAGKVGQLFERDDVSSTKCVILQS